METTKRLFVLLIVFGFFSCSSKRNVAGTYRSNLADLGFYITTVKLKTDNSFEYSFRGDLISNKATGHYRVNKRKLYLVYDFTPVDTSVLSSYKKLGINVTDSLKNENSYPHVFYLGKNKLFMSWQDEKIIRQVKVYHKRKKYLLFGSHYYKKKYYLKKIE
ncbi:hypothetical protein GO621_18720 [Mucilaginibacter sp. HMF7410]|uniref:Lipoprotein n=2 Tax=Mucilaginibacter arboris TaxID=2682090 RepID=A0A7K1T211_9SPHI|nr:hypothetical protein [Mucilaginibacter arboris]